MYMFVYACSLRNENKGFRTDLCQYNDAVQQMKKGCKQAEAKEDDICVDKQLKNMVCPRLIFRSWNNLGKSETWSGY